MPTPRDIAVHLRAQETRLYAAHGIDPRCPLPPFDTLTTAYVLGAFEQLGWQLALDEQVTSALLAERLGITRKYHRYLGVMLEILGQASVLRRLGDAWQVCATPVADDPYQLCQALAVQYPVYDAQLRLMQRCGPHIAEVLRGRRDPLELLFTDGIAEQVYRHMPYNRVYNAMVQETVAAALHHLPQDRMLRIVEIGAGTGGTTSFVLPILPADRTEYVFTDVSRAFIVKARQQFHQHPFLRYELLNIEQDPEAQGFTPHQCDLILAANVLHATRDLRQTLRHIRRLLVDGGLLVFLEGTGPHQAVDLVFGLTDGWWRFEDTNLRATHPLLPASAWRELLQEEAFTEAVTLPDASPEGTEPWQVLGLARATQAPQSVSQPRLSGTRQGAFWLIFADTGAVGQELAVCLEARGQTCVLVRQGQSYERLHDGSCMLNPAHPEDFERLLQSALPPEGPVCQGVVHLWGLDAVAPPDITLAALEADQLTGCGSALHLVQALLRHRLAHQPRLWIVTRGAQPVGATPSSLAVTQAPLWGLGRVVALEHPELWGKLVDLDSMSSASAAALQVCEEILSPDGEQQVAYHGAERYVARLVRYREAASATCAFVHCRPDSTYLITGGLGGLGLQVARLLVQRGARYVALLGRSGPSQQASEIISALESAGAYVVTMQVDVSQEPQMASALDHLQRSMPPLRGIIHSAGVVDDSILVHQTWAHFARVFAAKVLGAWNLHTLTQALSLDFFVLFSTAAAVVGSAGQGNHAAANTFLDALAHYRRALQLPALSINWGPWSEVGAAAKSTITERLANRGLETMTPQQGLAALELAMQGTAAQLAVMPIKWSMFLAQLPASVELSFLREVTGDAARAVDSLLPLAHRPSFWREVLQLPPEEHLALLTSQIQEQIARVLGHTSALILDVHQPLVYLGLDSLMAVELKNIIESDLRVSLPLRTFLAGSILEIAMEALDALKAVAPTAPESVAAKGALAIDSNKAEALLGKMEQLSNDEVDALLNAMLDDTRHKSE